MTSYNNIPEIELSFKRSGGDSKFKIASSSEAANAMRSFYDPGSIELFETFIVLFLDRASKSIGWFKVSQGGIDGAVVDVRLIMATALKCAASGIILSHNHPSGNINPSEADKTLTMKIGKACGIMDISLLDHIIVTKDSCYSFNDELISWRGDE